MYVLRYIVNQGTKQSESQHLLHSKRPRHVTYFCSHFSAETVAFQCGTQWSKFREGYVPKAGGCVPKWDAVSMLKYALQLYAYIICVTKLSETVFNIIRKSVICGLLFWLCRMSEVHE